MKQHQVNSKAGRLYFITIDEIGFPVFGGIVQIGVLAGVTRDFLNGGLKIVADQFMRFAGGNGW